MPSTIAAKACVVAVHQDLRRDVDIGPCSLTSDFDTIREGRCRGVSPARATVLWDVLVPDISKIVRAVDIAPVPCLWQVVDWGKRLADEGLDGLLWLDGARVLLAHAAQLGTDDRGKNEK